MWTRCLGWFSVMWVTKLFILSNKKRIFCPKTTQFGPKLAFLFILGQALPAQLVPCRWVGWWLWRGFVFSIKVQIWREARQRKTSWAQIGKKTQRAKTTHSAHDVSQRGRFPSSCVSEGFNKGSLHVRKVQSFWTLFKRPLTPPPFVWTFVLFCRGCFLKRVFAGSENLI